VAVVPAAIALVKTIEVIAAVLRQRPANVEVDPLPFLSSELAIKQVLLVEPA
jgi:hypothetical protein